MMMTADADLTRHLDDRLTTVCTQEVVEAAESTWPGALWATLEADGFTKIGVPEDNGGSGGELADALAVLQAVGRHAAPGPWAEAGFLIGQLVGSVAGVVPEGLLTVAPGAHRVTSPLSGEVLLDAGFDGVPWARQADHIAVVVHDRDQLGLVIIPRSQAVVIEGANLAGEARDTVRFADDSSHRVVALGAGGADRLALLGALSRAAMISGAVARVAEMTYVYSQQRQQFGRPIASFQLVQRHLVTLAEQSALVEAAVDGATAALVAGNGAGEIAAAKIVANTAATEAAKAAHQAHGAIGMTREYRLHQFTRRLWSWRNEFGNVNDWSSWLGSRLCANGADELYPFITDPSTLVGQF